MSSTCSEFENDKHYTCERGCTPYGSTPSGRSERIGITPTCWQCDKDKAKLALAAALEVPNAKKYSSDIQLRTLSGYTGETNNALLLLYKELEDADPTRLDIVRWALNILRNCQGTTYYEELLKK